MKLRCAERRRRRGPTMKNREPVRDWGVHWREQGLVKHDFCVTLPFYSRRAQFIDGERLLSYCRPYMQILGRRDQR